MCVFSKIFYEMEKESWKFQHAISGTIISDNLTELRFSYINFYFTTQFIFQADK